MLETFILLTTILAVTSGCAVLAIGNWRPFKLKYAGVVVSTLASVIILAFYTVSGSVRECAFPGQISTMLGLAQISRNISFILLHLAIGRDASHYKHRDRRK